MKVRRVPPVIGPGKKVTLRMQGLESPTPSPFTQRKNSVFRETESKLPFEKCQLVGNFKNGVFLNYKKSNCKKRECGR